MKTSQKVYLPFKRLIGFVGSVLGIIVCFVLLWWWVFPVNCIVTNGHPMFNRHRIGKNGIPFVVYKFRTMKNDSDPHMSSRDENISIHLTSFGKFLRTTSIDETPQLFNIFLGKMSFIGPRPLIDMCDDLITINERKINGSIVLRPGISGYAQIHRRSNLDPKSKAEYDYIYLKKMSLLFDIKIFIFTILFLFGTVKGR